MIQIHMVPDHIYLALKLLLIVFFMNSSKFALLRYSAVFVVGCTKHFWFRKKKLLFLPIQNRNAYDSTVAFL